MSAGVHVYHRYAEPTPPQLNYIAKLGGNVATAKLMTREAASRYIDRLKTERRASRTATHSHSSPYVHAHPDENDAPPAPQETATEVPTVLLDMVPDGRFALRLDEAHPWVFFRKSHPKTGQFEGCTKIQTQHGPNYALCYVVWPNGKISWYARQYMEELKFLLLVHKRAGVDYGRKMKRCQICGLELTDPRSRKYTIGPDCETRHPGVIAYVDALIASGELEDVDD